MEKIIRKLRGAFWGAICATLAVVLVFETDMLPVGTLTAGGDAEFLLTSLMELLTITCIPLALRLFKTRRVAGALAAGGPRALAVWALARIMILGCPMFANALLYYLFMKATFAYMAMIFLISMLFAYPSKDRCMYETQKHDGE